MSKKLTKQEYEAQLKQNKADQKIAQEAFEQEQARIEKELAGLEVTYSIADRFKYMGRRGEKCILVALSGTTASIVSLRDGRKIGKAYCVNSFNKITLSEYKQICDCGTFTRYFDFLKGETI